MSSKLHEQIKAHLTNPANKPVEQRTSYATAMILKADHKAVRHALVRGELRGEFCIASIDDRNNPVWTVA